MSSLWRKMRNDNSNLLFLLEKSTNGNVVCFEAQTKDPSDATSLEVSAYWMDLDPETRAKARAQGKMDDRVEFGVIDWVAFGFDVSTRKSVSNEDEKEEEHQTTTQPHDHASTDHTTTADVLFSSLSCPASFQRIMRLRQMPHLSIGLGMSSSRKPMAVVTINKMPCRLESLFLDLEQTLNPFAPKVHAVHVTGTSLEDASVQKHTVRL